MLINRFTVIAMLCAVLLFVVPACGQEKDVDTTDVNDESDGWLDPVSGLMWQVHVIEWNYINWIDAHDYCEGMVLAGESDWRMPTISELRTLIRGCDRTKFDGQCGVIDQCLMYKTCREDICDGCGYIDGPVDGCFWPSEIHGGCCWYWSSSTVSDDTEAAWNVSFADGKIDRCGKGADNRYIRCVRP